MQRYWFNSVGLAAFAFTVACGGEDATQHATLDFGPAPEQGYQIVMGPFQVPPGEEVQLCQTMKLPNTEPIAVNRFSARKFSGSHHTIMFTSDVDYPDRVFPCWGTINFDDWKFIFDTQEEDLDWQLPDGKAFIMKPHQQVLIQAHYQNATVTESPEGGAVALNLHTTVLPPSDDKTAPVYGMFTVNRRVELPPRQVTGPFSRLCVFNRDASLNALYGHFHSRGRRFTIEHLGVEETSEIAADEFRYNFGQIYESTSWDKPPFVSSPSEQLPGDGKNGYLVGAGEAIRFSCWYENNTDDWIVFGSHALVNEHCNLFFNYSIAPSDQNDHLEFECVNGNGGW